MINGTDSKYERRFRDLVAEGEQLLSEVPHDSPIEHPHRSRALAWILSTGNLLEATLASDSLWVAEARRLLPHADATLWPEGIASLLGVLSSAANEWSRGLVDRLEFHYLGVALEDFLKHADGYIDTGKKIEAAVLASAVLEDTVKRLCTRHRIVTDAKSLDSLVSALKSTNVLNKSKAERVRSYIAIRNRAFHAEWGAFDEKDLKQMIEGLQELLEDHLAGNTVA